MIHEEICTYEVCKLAKERGFNVPTDRYYHIYDDVIDAQNSLEMTSDGCADFYNSLNRCRCAAPTQSLMQRWLREEKKFEVYVRNFEKTTNYPQHYWNFITDGNGKTLKVGNKMFDTYELALEDALKYVLKNLV